MIQTQSYLQPSDLATGIRDCYALSDVSEANVFSDYRTRNNKGGVIDLHDLTGDAEAF